jgi:hypothetical protein
VCCFRDVEEEEEGWGGGCDEYETDVKKMRDVIMPCL